MVMDSAGNSQLRITVRRSSHGRVLSVARNGPCKGDARQSRILTVRGLTDNSCRHVRHLEQTVTALSRDAAACLLSRTHHTDLSRIASVSILGKQLDEP